MGGLSVWVDLNAVGFVIIQSAVTAELARTGAIHWIRRALLGRRPGPIRVALASGLLSTVLTNDAALIAVGPVVTHGVRRPHRVLLPALIAANSIGAVTPLGNPQNAIVYSHYRLNAWDFLRVQAPVAAALAIPGLAYALLQGGRLPSATGPPPSPKELAAITVSAACLIAHVPLYLWFPPLMLGYAALRPRSIQGVDWVVVALLTTAVLIPHAVQWLGWHVRISDPYLSALLLSQAISNVPTTVILLPGTEDWVGLLHGVTVGGFGTPVASIANIIALRMAGGGLRPYALTQASCLVLGTVAHYVAT
ncbi:MAG: SLC13 family permease [Euryarchaeota archaeon]